MRHPSPCRRGVGEQVQGGREQGEEGPDRAEEEVEEGRPGQRQIAGDQQDKITGSEKEKKPLQAGM